MEELGQEGFDAFENFDDTSIPIAAASLGQVYRLSLKTPAGSDQTIRHVAVKVQRPDMIRAVSLDLYLLRKYCQIVESCKAALMGMGVLSERRQFDVVNHVLF